MQALATVIQPLKGLKALKDLHGVPSGRQRLLRACLQKGLRYLSLQLCSSSAAAAAIAAVVAAEAAVVVVVAATVAVAVAVAVVGVVAEVVSAVIAEGAEAMSRKTLQEWTAQYGEPTTFTPWHEWRSSSRQVQS